MTKKGFNYYIYEDGVYYYVCDNTKKGDDKILFEFDTKFEAMELCGLLNKLHEENKKLKQVNEMLQMDFTMTERNLIEENRVLKQEMGELGRIHAEEINKIEDEFDDEILKLEKENEQLKQQLEYQQEAIVDAIDSLMNLPSATLYLMKQWLEAFDDYDSIGDMKNTFYERMKELEE